MSRARRFRDRTEAGEHLAKAIHAAVLQLGSDGVVVQPIVYALPRGGLPVAVPVARQLGCPLEIVVAKKISHPQNPEVAMGAVTVAGQVLWAEPKPGYGQEPQLEQAALNEALNLAQCQLAQLAPASPQVDPKGALAILVDDGIATGMTMAVAAQALRVQQPAAVWLCTPVAPQDLVPWLEQWGERLIVLKTPQLLLSVSRFYTEFHQVKTEEALACLQAQNDWLSGRS